jgi:flagellar hook-associated protein 2
VAAGSAAGLSIDASNDTFSVSVDGAPRVQITLAHKTDNTPETQAAELQAKNNAAVSGKVTVATSGGALTITSDRYGSASRLSIGEGTALATLKLAAGATGSGQDVAGTINGEAATGLGQVLTGKAGNPNTDGLQVLVERIGSLGGGPEATLTVTKGVFSRFEEYLSDLTDPASGTVGVQQSSLTRSLETVQAQIKTMETRLAVRRESLLAQFQAMEKAVGQLNSQANFLTNALSGLGANWSWNSK